MTDRRISETLMLRDGSICCRTCSHVLGPAGRGWKEAAVLRPIKFTDLPGAGSGVSDLVELRRFFCPSCASLLDTETALPGDPFLEDVVVP
jgi:acetone carboxylase gamma subunit